jgi:hypothetical protein
MTARFLLHIRAWDGKSAYRSQNIALTGVVSAESDPGITSLFTRRTIGNNILTDFGDDPVVSARDHSSLHQDGPEYDWSGEVERILAEP